MSDGLVLLQSLEGGFEIDQGRVGVYGPVGMLGISVGGMRVDTVGDGVDAITNTRKEGRTRLEANGATL